MLHLIRKKNPATTYQHSDWYYDVNTFVWGRACKRDDNTYYIMQEPVTCKDYIIDTYYRSPVGDLFTAEEKAQWCYFIQIPADLQENFIKNMTAFFWPYEDKHGFTRTTLQQVTRKMAANVTSKPFIIETDSKWGTNLASLSMYLSIVRLCIYCTNMSEVNLINLRMSGYTCNETYYIRNLSKVSRPIWDYFVQNPTETLITASNISGYPVPTSKGHGVCGIFYMLQNMDAYARGYDEKYHLPPDNTVFKTLLNTFKKALEKQNVQPMPQL